MRSCRERKSRRAVAIYRYGLLAISVLAFNIFGAGYWRKGKRIYE